MDEQGRRWSEIHSLCGSGALDWDLYGFGAISSWGLLTEGFVEVDCQPRLPSPAEQ